MKNTSFDVDALVTYGSAGVKNGTTLADIHAGKVYATKADGDKTAWWGMRSTTKSLDPRDIDGVIVFSSKEKTEAGNETSATTDHPMFLSDERVSKDHPDFADREKDADKYAEGERGYMSPDATALDRMGNLLAKGSAK